MTDRRIYLDNAATTFPKPDSVADSVCNFIRNIGCNINRGSYSSAYETEDVVMDTRTRLVRMFGGTDERNVIFTSGVTMSLNMVLRGLARKGDHVLTSSMEHNAVMRPLVKLKDEGIITFDRVPCDAIGYLDADRVSKYITDKTRIVVMTHASNISGTILPIAKIGRLCRERGLIFVVDAAQTAGVTDIDMQKMCIDALCFTGHKGLMGPQGIGGFILGERLSDPHSLDTVISGGTGSASHLETMPDFLPDRFEAGTLNIPGIYGLNAGLKFIEETGIPTIFNHEHALAERFTRGLEDITGVRVVGRGPEISYEDISDCTSPATGFDAPAADPRFTCNGQCGDCAGCDKAPRHVGVVSVVFTKMDQARAAFLLDDRFGIQTRVGLHCAPSAHRTLGTFPEGTVRFSFGFFNTEADVDAALSAINEILK